MIKIIPYILSLFTVMTMVMAGNKYKLTWFVGLANQSLWLYYILETMQYGLLPMNITLWTIYFRNHFKWN